MNFFCHDNCIHCPKKIECTFEKGIPSGVDVFFVLTMVWLLMCSTKARMATRTTSVIAIFERNDNMTNNNNFFLRINNSIQTNHDGFLTRTLELTKYSTLPAFFVERSGFAHWNFINYLDIYIYILLYSFLFVWSNFIFISNNLDKWMNTLVRKWVCRVGTDKDDVEECIDARGGAYKN